MTADTVVLVHEPSPVGDLNSPGAVIRQITGGNPAIAEAGEHDSQRLDIFVGQVELWHYLLNTLRSVSSRGLELIIGPIVPRLFNISMVAEEKLFECLSAKSSQLDADARLLFHSWNIVTTKATIFAHQRFAARDVFGVLQPPVDIRDRLPLASQSGKISRDRQRLLIAQP